MSEIKSLLFSHSHHLLTVRGCSALLDVLSFEGEEALSEPFRYVIEFTSADKTITPQQMLMQDATFTLQAPADQGFGINIQQPVRTIQGVVMAFERLSASRDETHYSLTLQPRLALLSRSHQNRIYQDMSVPDIVEHILRTRHAMRGEDFVFTLAQAYPRREQVMQYGEDDLRFITRLLGEVGIWFRFTADTRLNIDVVEFYDDQRHYEQGLVLPSVPPSGQHDGGTESVWALKSQHNVVQQSVFTRDYNYRNAPEEMSQSADVTSGDVTTYGEAYHWADNYLAPGSDGQRNPEPESGAFYARLRHERYLNDQTRLSGRTSSAALAPGRELKVTGGAEVTEVFRQGVVITGIHSRARRDRSYEVAFTAIPFSENYGYRPQPGDRPVMVGTLPARVTSTKTNDIYGHIDRDGRYKVNLLFDRDHWSPGEESLWVRQARPYAGDTYGLHLPLLAGTEVAIAFEQGDPDRPYIAGVLHDSTHPDPVTIRNYKRNVLRTPANNKIRLDDARGKEHIKVSTEYGGKSQLNLGHLVDSEKQPRGEGVELRTDSYGAIRAGKGIMLTTESQPRVQGKQLDMAAAIAELEKALSLAKTLQQCAATAGVSKVDTGQQQQLSQVLKQLKGAGLLTYAGEGQAHITPASLQFSAGQDLVATAGNDASINVVKKFSLAVGEKLALFARKLGIQIIAGAGDITTQAQRGAMHMLSQQDFTLTSTDSKLNISAKQGIQLACGGGGIRINADGSVEVFSPTGVDIKAPNFAYKGPESVQIQMPNFDKGAFKHRYRLHASDDPEQILTRQKFRVKSAAGDIIEGETDSEGCSPLLDATDLDTWTLELCS
ncbi:type VI secretion system Vgr family protein [Klebsiella michiganensis]|uniref:type VI secretion system Vgr family protein n=1 Tax=Klebsiella michiganensis TaxID=1134687 RepID=UPI0015F70001|nr:type VI secretion system tip protein VgrG [Klebsiella michiganensis]MCZ0061916.1 type VI secretion system tip protein VgrG [Klebsiella michiganensis]MCZ0077921.1 type VI secretion system tip protein VgrG [Klebsiella michiganensis]MCZ9440371.1 type VI secretion system tip protein VgrG [Klebsiella michiganensis]WAT42252.1 type VI secretion system tip protein VgrG [Klebsiella michiganensis]WAX86981.1 type VI secretion system tip protein VgrG [Klebsiella michiganensis]